MRRYRPLSLATIACALLWALPAVATTLIKASLPALAQASSAVVRGTVRKVESRWSHDHLRVYTVVEVSVTETLKGNAGAVVHLLQPGGVVGEIGQSVGGTAHFSEGEEVVLFLRPHGAGRYALVGMAQGKYNVRPAANGQPQTVVPENPDALLLDPKTRQPVQADLRPIALDQLRALVREAGSGSAR